MSMSSPDADRPGRETGDGPATEGRCSFAPPPTYFRPPPLGIIHLLAWMVVTVALMEFFAAAGGPRHLSAVRQVLYQAIQFVRAAVFGAAVVGTTVILLGKVRGETGRFQPGHWFILVETVKAVLNWMLLAVVLAFGQTERSDEVLSTFHHLFWGAIGLLSAGAYFLVARQVRNDRPWRVPTITMAIVGVTVYGLLLSNEFSRIDVPAAFGALRSLVDTVVSAALWPIWPLIVSVTLGVALLIDVARGARRDWVHSLGVWIIVLSSVLDVASWGVFNLLRGTG